MAIVPFSSFDPVFWLHHANVDRIFAMWQVVHPDSWVQPEAAGATTWTTTLGQMLDSQSPLTPFFAADNGTFWNSDMLRDPQALGYTYPELAGFSLSNMTTNLMVQSQVTTAINRLYGGSSPVRLALNSKRGMPKVRRSRELGFSYTEPRQQSRAFPPAFKIMSENRQYREWTANIRVMKQALNGPFFISLSLKTPSLTHIGTMGIFASPSIFASMMKMAPGAGQIAGTVPLTAAFMDRVAEGAINSLEPDDMWAWFQQNIDVEVTKGDGTPVDPKTVSGLGITIASYQVQAPSNERKLPVWGTADFEQDIVL